MKKMIMFMMTIFLMTGCSNGSYIPDGRKDVVEGKELFCIAESEAQAVRIAEDYGIELVSFADGVAIFHTEDDPDEVIRYGKDNDLVLLSLNTKIKR